MRQVAPLEVFARQLDASADALGHVRPRHLQVHAARMDIGGCRDGEEAFDLIDDIPDAARLEAVDLARVAVHRIDAPDRIATLAAGRAHQLGKVRLDVRRPEAPDQHQPPRDVVRIEAVDEAEQIVGRKTRPAFDAHRIANTACELDMRAVDLPRAIADP